MDESSTDPEPEPSNGVSGVIRHVIGRGTARGIPELSEVVIETSDGSEIRASIPTPAGERVIAGIVPVEFNYFEFAECPICLEPNAGSREHVPPYSIGGRVLTLTCEACNNEFGSRFESHLQTWYEHSTGRVRLSGPTVRGRRQAGEFLFRQTASGEFVLYQTGRSDPAIHEILENGAFELELQKPDDSAVHLAAVKNAYLAGCVLMQEIPRTPHADALRAELMAARESDRGARLELGPIARSLRLVRGDSKPNPGQINLIGIPESTGAISWAISFNQVFAVDWPLDPIAVGEASTSGT